MRTATIEMRDVVKTYGNIRALDGLNLSVAEGEVHGFLGPNGAGKSTTIRTLLGLVRADQGSCRLLGGDPWRDAAQLHSHIAYVPGDVTLWPQLTGGEVIDVLGRMRGGIDRPRRAELLDRFQLDPSRRTRTYSKGNRQKVALVAAFSSRVPLYLLDEPTSGLDPLMEAQFQQTVEEVRHEGATVLLSSHILAEAEALSDRISIIRSGQVVQTGTLTELRHLTRTTIEAHTTRSATDLARLPGIHDFSADDRSVRFAVDSDRLDTVVAALAATGVRSLVAHPPTLEELFLRHYGDDPVAT
jgi:ABC-2 type transport system ATP-binding protein